MNKLIKNQFTDPDYKAFIPLAIILKSVIDVTNDRSSEVAKNHTSIRLATDSTAVKTIEDALKPLGFKRVSGGFRNGKSALVFEANNHQMLRIVSSRAGEPERSKGWCVLQPLKTVTCGRGTRQFTIELLPKVHTLEEIMYDPILSKQYHIGPKDYPGIAKELMTHLVHQDKPKLFFDPCPENIAIIRKGNTNVPVIIDAGAIVDIEKIYDTICEYTQDTFAKIFIERCDSIPALADKLPRNASINANVLVSIYISLLFKQVAHAYDYEGAQAYHLRSLKLKPGQANYVITDEDMERFYAERKNLTEPQKWRDEGLKYDDGTPYNPKNSVYAKMVNEDGLYPAEIRTITQAAYNSPKSEGNKKGFCHEIELQRQKYLQSEKKI